ncbi:MAG: hypothetical protein J1F38_08155 [Muribaculaceae bacterium]|nr:hypothetical protein [Muribaculaceae bacterium]
MNINTFLKFVVILTCFSSLTALAEPTPRWVKKGVIELNKKRSNDSYSFHIFNQSDIDKSKFKVDPFTPLLEYVDTTYHVDKSKLIVDSIPGNGTLPTTYMVTFNQEGKEQSVYARLVDRFQKYEDYPDGSYDYNFYQLYAISNPGYSTPDFDRFTLKRKYGIKPMLMSIIPGFGQIYKGQPAKGYSFLGVEAAMVASIIYATDRANHWNNLGKKYPEFYDNYQSKASTFRQWRMFCFIAGGGLYIYNLLDAAIANGARYVEVKRNNAPNMQFSFMPVFSPDMLGFGININL